MATIFRQSKKKFQDRIDKYYWNMKPVKRGGKRLLERNSLYEEVELLGKFSNKNVKLILEVAPSVWDFQSECCAFPEEFGKPFHWVGLEEKSGY